MDSVEQTLQILSNATGTNTELLNIKVSPGVGDIVVQLDVFNEQNEKPKTTRQSSTESINLNSHQEVFQTIMQQITKTSNERTFLSILQHLLRIDPIESLSDVMWKVAEKLVHRATQLENAEEAERLVISTVAYKFSCQNCRAEVKEDNENVIENKNVMNTSLTSQSISSNPPPPPPPPLPTGLNSSSPSKNVPPIPPGLPPPPPPFQKPGLPPPLPNSLTPSNNLLLPQQNAPRASRKLKTFNWAKIPPHKIMNKLNIWTIMANDRQYKCVELIDFKGIEGLFALQTINKANKDEDMVDGVALREKKEKEPKYIHLLDAQRSLKVNIFLSQFKGCNSEDIMQLILTGDCKILNLERLKDLKKFFENEDEILLLKSFAGDRQRLASAERFLISIMEISNFKLRIESMILKEEFQLNATYLEPCLNDIIQAGYKLMKSKTLQEILSIIIIIGNFLNSGGYAGNAAGIKLSSLTKLTEIKANKTGMHLLHLIAMEVQRYNPELLDLNNELSFLESVSKTNNDQIEKDIKDMELALDAIKKQIYVPTTDVDIKHQMHEFITEADEKMEILERQIAELKSLRIAMADFFCEDITTFKVDECFEIFYKFCEQFKQALKENDKRKQLEIQASIRQKQKEEQLTQKVLTGSTTASKSPAHLPSKRLCLRTSRESIEINSSKKNEDDLIAFLQNSNRKRNREKETHRKTRLDKRPDLLKLNFVRERDQHSPNFAESKHEIASTECTGVSKTPCLEEEKKTNLIQKSWKRLMEGYKASQYRDSDLMTPDVSHKREGIRIFIRSNSMADNRSGEPKTQASIKIIKTPLPKTASIFNYSLKEIEASQADISGSITENFEEKNSNSLDPKNSQHIELTKGQDIVLGIEASPTSEKESTIEMRGPRTKLKTMASIVELGYRYSSINEEDLKTTIKKLKTPTLEKSQFCFSPTTLKSNNWNWEHRQLPLNSVDEEKSNLVELNEGNQKRQLQVATECLKVENPAQKELFQEPYTKTVETEKSGEDNKIEANEEITSKDVYTDAPVIDSEKEIIIDGMQTKENFSQRLVSKLQNKIRAFSPSRPSEITEKQQKTPGDLNEFQLLYSSKGTIDSERGNCAHTKKSFVSRLQSKIRALSPLKLQPEQVANFQSYVSFKNNETNSPRTLKAIEDLQLETNQQKQKAYNTQQKAKENVKKEQNPSKDNKNQSRLSRPSSRASISSAKIKDSPKKLVGPIKNSKSPEKSTNSTKPVTTESNRKSPNKQTSLNIDNAKQSTAIAKDKLKPLRTHCQNKPELWRKTTDSSKNVQRRPSSSSAKILPKSKSSLSSQIVPASAKTTNNPNAKITNSQQQANKKTRSPGTLTTKSTNSRTNPKENLISSINLKPTLNSNHSTPAVRSSSLQCNFITPSSQLYTTTSRHAEVSPRLSSSGKNVKKFTFSEICLGNTNLFPNSKPAKFLTKPNSASAIKVSPTTVSHTTEQSFKRPCKKI